MIGSQGWKNFLPGPALVAMGAGTDEWTLVHGVFVNLGCREAARRHETLKANVGGERVRSLTRIGREGTRW